MGNSEDSFAQGQDGIIFDYASSLAAIKAKSPFLNIRHRADAATRTTRRSPSIIQNTPASP